MASDFRALIARELGSLRDFLDGNDLIRLEITMDDVFGVSCGEGGGNLTDQTHNIRKWHAIVHAPGTPT